MNSREEKTVKAEALGRSATLQDESNFRPALKLKYILSFDWRTPVVST
ncbi:hypothetical protein YEEN111655_15660 [Yersinia entomophaga]